MTSDFAALPASAEENFILVEAKALTKAMKIATAIIDRHVTNPILSTVRLSYGATGLTIEATDLDLHAKVAVDEIDGAGEWMCCISSKELVGIAAAAGVTPLKISPHVGRVEGSVADKTDHRAHIEAGDAQYSVQAYDPDDFPTIFGERMHRIETFTNGHLVSMLKKVAFCISTEETRYYLNGVNWSAKPQGMRFTATDGHRLAACRYATNEDGVEFSRIIPQKTVAILIQFMDASDVEVFSVGTGNTINDNVLDIRSPGVTLRSKLIDGTYPDFDRVIPTEENTRMNVYRDEFLAAVRQATAIGAWRGQAIRLHGVAGRMNVEVKNPDFGTAKVSTSADWPEGLQAFGVNSRYMTEMIKSCQGEISLGIAEGSYSPITLSDEDKNMTRVVMPMRV